MAGANMIDQYLFDLGVPLERGDPCARKARHNPNSLANKPNKTVQSQKILNVLATGNFTGKEIAAKLYVPYHTISGRFLLMRENGFIRLTGEKRDGAGVYAKV